MTNLNILPNIDIIDNVTELFINESGLEPFKLEYVQLNILEADITNQGLFEHIFKPITVRCKVFQDKKDVNKFEFSFFLCWYMKNGGHFNSTDLATVIYTDSDYKSKYCFEWSDPKAIIYTSS